MSRTQVTSIEVARRAGFSQSTVSRAFAPGSNVAPETREAILQTAKRLGYRPNVIARSLSTSKSRIVGVAMSYLENQFYPSVLQSLSSRLQREGYHVLLFTADQGDFTDAIIEKMMEFQVAGLVLASVSLSSRVARECSRVGIPVVMFNRTSDVDDASSVTGANDKGGSEIASFLVAGGHKKPAFIAGHEDTSTSRERERGFRAGLSKRGIKLARREVGSYSFEGASDAMRRLLRDGDRPDAVFCANDHMAIAALEVARHEFGLQVPQDISIVGFDDVGPTRWPSYSITSFEQPVDQMVDACVSMLLARIEDNTRPTEHLITPGRLIVRESARTPGDTRTQRHA